jgi:hypothetical protein
LFTAIASRRRVAAALGALALGCCAPVGASASSETHAASTARSRVEQQQPKATQDPAFWAPSFRAAVAYARHRQAGSIAFALRYPHHAWVYRGGATFPSASVFKSMLLVAYLNDRRVAHRRLTSSDLSLLSPMIRWSSDAAATRVRNFVGDGAIYRVAGRVGMRHLHIAPIWGRSRIAADDMAKFMLRVDLLIPARHRQVAMHLLATVIRPQRWGLATVHVPAWKLYFKSGWGLGTGWVDHQVALLTHGTRRVSLAILTFHDPDHAYGKATLRGIALRLLRGLGPSSVLRP